VGLPRESRISRAVIASMSAMRVLLVRSVWVRRMPATRLLRGLAKASSSPSTSVEGAQVQGLEGRPSIHECEVGETVEGEALQLRLRVPRAHLEPHTLTAADEAALHVGEERRGGVFGKEESDCILSLAVGE